MEWRKLSYQIISLYKFPALISKLNGYFPAASLKGKLPPSDLDLFPRASRFNFHVSFTCKLKMRCGIYRSLVSINFDVAYERLIMQTSLDPHCAALGKSHSVDSRLSHVNYRAPQLIKSQRDCNWWMQLNELLCSENDKARRQKSWKESRKWETSMNKKKTLMCSNDVWVKSTSAWCIDFRGSYF